MSQGKSAVTLELLDDISDEQIHEAEAYAALYALGGYTYNNVIHEVPDEQCNAAKDDELETDTYGEDEEGIDEMDSDVDEETLIQQKSPYEQKFIREHRQLFSESLNPSRYLKCPPMKIKLKQSLSSKLDPSLYRFKPRTIPLHIKEQAQQLLDDLEKQGIIRRLGPNETSEVCAPAGFVPKKSKKLRFVIDFTSLNKYIARPVHSFPSTDQIQQAIRHDTCFIACVDFPSGYFQLCLDKAAKVRPSSTLNSGVTSFSAPPRVCLVQETHSTHSNIHGGSRPEAENRRQGSHTIWLYVEHLEVLRRQTMQHCVRVQSGPRPIWPQPSKHRT